METSTTEGSFSRFVPQPVIDQINKREEKWGKQDKTVEEFEVIHGNTVWAVLRSGVNVPKDENQRSTPVLDKTTVTTTDELARQTVLGGEMKREIPDGNEFSFDFRSGVELSTPDIATAAYRKDSVQGHRPVPGITGFSVKTKDTWGMIMEANINIKCWSRDDLEKLDLVYFKPGFPALFEWGHTLYFREDGSICKNPKPIVTNDEFFGNISYQDYSRLDKQVYEGRQQDCNREAVFGYITNFSWSFNPDGSYDCSLQILSKGAVLEGLRMTSDGIVDKSDKQEDVCWWDASPYHGVLKAFQSRYEELSNTKSIVTIAQISKVPELDNGSDNLDLKLMPGRASLQEANSNKAWLISGKTAINSSNITINIPTEGAKILQDFPVVVLPVTKGTWLFGRKRVEMYYMTLRSLLHLINVIHGGGTGSGGFYFDTLSSKTFGDSSMMKEHASLNPLVAIKPSQVGNATYQIDASSLMGNAKGAQQQCKDDDQILNIWVNYNIFVQVVESAIASSPEGYRIEGIVSEFLASIQKAFGNVNLFGLHNNSSNTSYFEVVDRTMVRPKDADVPNIPKINITGLNNTVVGLQIKSDVSNDIANSMCIAAASPAAKTEGADNADTETVFWGENCTPRWCVLKDPPEKTVADQQANFEKDKKEWQKKFKKFYEDVQNGKLTGTEKSDNVSDNTEVTMNNVAEKVTFFQVNGERYYRNDDRADVTAGSYLHMGIIPYKMSLTLLGLSRLYVGNVFMLKNNGILPRKYDNWGYLITGINHTIKNNQWFTELTTNYFPVFSGMKFQAPKELPSNSLILKPEYRTEGEDRSKPRRMPNEEFDDDCDYRKAFKDSGIDYPPTKSDYGGRCARYTYNWAKAYTQGKSALGGGAVLRNGQYEPAYAAGGNANQNEYWNNLESLGYQRGSAVKMTGAELAKLKGGETINGITIKEGDVIQYDNANHTYGHTCFYDGEQWCSDTDQRSANCYDWKETFTVRLFSSPPKHKDWECGVHQNDLTRSAYWQQ